MWCPPEPLVHEVISEPRICGDRRFMYPGRASALLASCYIPRQCLELWAICLIDNFRKIFRYCHRNLGLNMVNEELDTNISLVFERMGMYIGEPSYEKMTMFLNGVDFATNRKYLKGFNEWLREKYLVVSARSWEGHIVDLVEDNIVNLGEDTDDKELLVFLYECLTEFRKERLKYN